MHTVTNVSTKNVFHPVGHYARPVIEKLFLANHKNNRFSRQDIRLIGKIQLNLHKPSMYAHRIGQVIIDIQPLHLHMCITFSFPCP